MTRIARDPKICNGEPVIKGTRVTLRTVLASLAEGAKTEAILTDKHPSVAGPDSFRASHDVDTVVLEGLESRKLLLSSRLSCGGASFA